MFSRSPNGFEQSVKLNVLGHGNVKYIVDDQVSGNGDGAQQDHGRQNQAGLRRRLGVHWIDSAPRVPRHFGPGKEVIQLSLNVPCIGKINGGHHSSLVRHALSKRSHQSRRRFFAVCFRHPDFLRGGDRVPVPHAAQGKCVLIYRAVDTDGKWYPASKRIGKPHRFQNKPGCGNLHFLFRHPALRGKCPEIPGRIRFPVPHFRVQLLQAFIRSASGDDGIADILISPGRL